MRTAAQNYRQSHISRVVREPRSKLIVWSDRLELGVRAVDEQHMELVGLINRLSDAMYSGRGRDMMRRTLVTLEKYAAYHFDTEEKLMDRYCYPESAAHKRGHESFTGMIVEFRQKFDEGGIVVPAEILCFLREWIISHIMTEDRALGQLLKPPAVQL